MWKHFGTCWEKMLITKNLVFSKKLTRRNDTKIFLHCAPFGFRTLLVMSLTILSGFIWCKLCSDDWNGWGYKMEPKPVLSSSRFLSKYCWQNYFQVLHSHGRRSLVGRIFRSSTFQNCCIQKCWLQIKSELSLFSRVTIIFISYESRLKVVLLLLDAWWWTPFFIEWGKWHRVWWRWYSRRDKRPHSSCRRPSPSCCTRLSWDPSEPCWAAWEARAPHKTSASSCSPCSASASTAHWWLWWWQGWWWLSSLELS